MVLVEGGRTWGVAIAAGPRAQSEEEEEERSSGRCDDAVGGAWG